MSQVLPSPHRCYFTLDVSFARVTNEFCFSPIRSCEYDAVVCVVLDELRNTVETLGRTKTHCVTFNHLHVYWYDTGHYAALDRSYCRLDKRKFSFSLRTINDWKQLSHDCVNASSVNMFRNKIGNYLARVSYT